MASLSRQLFIQAGCPARLFRAERALDLAAAWFHGEGDSTVCSVSEFQQAVDGFLRDLVEAVNIHHGDDAVQVENIFSCRCDGFRTSRAAGGRPVWLPSALDAARIADSGAAMVMCIRIEDMDSDPAAGSHRGQCMRCGSPVWIAPSSRVIIEEQSRPVLCIQCASTEPRIE